jgi:DNA-binding NtrC family response regulator
VAARHGAEAIRLLAERDFDLMVLDVMMPIANAFDVLAFMREQGPWTQTIILTAAHDAQLATLNTDNVCAVVQKPFDMDTLQTLVRSCVAPVN